MRVFASAEQVQAAQGEHLGSSEWLTITQEQVNQFAEATLDHQWIHVDVERANAGPFGGPIAHGFLTLSLVSHLNQQIYRFENLTMGINYGTDKVRFPSPVKVGSRVRASSELAEVTETKDGLQLAVNTTVEIEGSDKPACAAQILTRVVF